MDSYFIFNNINSRDYGIIVNKLPTIIKPSKNIEKIEVIGRNGFLTKDYNTYKSSVKSVECTIKNIDKLDSICSWLDGSGDLIFSNEEDKVYKATIINQIPFSKIIKQWHKFLIQFECQPLKKSRIDIDYMTTLSYSVDRNSIAINPLSTLNYTGGNTFQSNIPIEINKKEELIVHNFGTMEAKPVLELWGSGNIRLIINSDVITLNDIQGTIIIDSEMMECYKGTLPCNNKMFGEFLTLKLGKNIIKWEGNLERIKIKHNTCYL